MTDVLLRRSGDRSARAVFGTERVTALIGPVGSGKSTALRSWYASLDADSAAWIDLAAADRPAAVVGTLESLAGRTALFVDHAECVTDQEVIAMIEPCLEASVRLFVASRRRLPEALPTGDVRVVGPMELRLADGVVREGLATRCPSLGAGELERLVGDLDGWAAGLALLGQALDGAGDPETVAREFGGRDHAVAEYFEIEVMRELDPGDREFLTRIAVLERPEPAAADALSDDAAALERLTRIARQHAMLVETEGVFRWLPLGREYLLSKLGRSERATLHRRAAEWFRANGRHDEAVAQATDIGAHDLITETIRDVGLLAACDGRSHEVLQWVETLPAHEIARPPSTALVTALATWLGGAPGAPALVDDWLAVADAHAGDAPLGAVTYRSALAATRSLISSASPAARSDLAAEAFAVEGSASSPWAGLAALAAGSGAYFDGSRDDARRWLNESLRIADTHQAGDHRWSSALIAPAALGLLALIEADVGEYDRSDAFGRAAGLARGPRIGARADLGPQRVASALASVRDGHLEVGALDLADLAVAPVADELAALAGVEAARCQIELADSAAADRQLTIARAAADRAGWPQLVADRYSTVSGLVAQQGRPAADRHELSDRELEVLQLLDSDLSRREIGTALCLAHNTVKTYVQRLYQKLDVSSRPAAIAAARDRGWLKPPARD